MNKKIFILPVLVILSIVLTYPSFGKTIRVKTKDNAIRQECRFSAPILKKLKYNNQLEIVSRNGDWIKVKSDTVEGCIHKSALIENRRDITLINLYGPLDKSYGVVDAIQLQNVSINQVNRFAKGGNLNIPAK